MPLYTAVDKRSAAFPLELAYRLINMYSVKGDLVLDPYLGVGTTTLAAIASGRNSIGYEIENAFQDVYFKAKKKIIETSQQIIRKRLFNHLDFIALMVICGFLHSLRFYKYKFDDEY